MKPIKSDVSPSQPASRKRKSGNDSFADNYAATFSKNRRAKIFALFLAALVSFNLACESPSLKANQSKPAEARTDDNLPSFENDLQSMRNADFDFVYVFRRKDGGALDAEDKKYLKTYAPVATNRFVITDENKAVIAGSSYKFEAENLDNLQKRFTIENFSKPESQETNANQNSSR